MSTSSGEPRIGLYGGWSEEKGLATWIVDIEGLGKCAVNFTVADPSGPSEGRIQGRILRVLGKHVVAELPGGGSYTTFVPVSTRRTGLGSL